RARADYSNVSPHRMVFSGSNVLLRVKSALIQNCFLCITPTYRGSVPHPAFKKIHKTENTVSVLLPPRKGKNLSAWTDLPIYSTKTAA
ncbi:MAG TPA: hypothetical protein PLG17_04195, partial [Thermodesulfobacteriota bacterium]|nr:hypothetical protein [Thermodesulfobacteriota bacterium]